MRFTALLGCVAVVAACTAKENPPADSVAATAPAPAPAPAAPMSLASMAGMWNVKVKPEGKDTVVTTYVLNTTDSADWAFTFPDGQKVKMRITGRSGDTVTTETDWFKSSVRKGMPAKSNTSTWMQDGKLMAKTTVHYKTTGPDTVRVFVSEGTKQ
ncbi:MAG TPA: hypothetical protein VM099_04760 [Gemmatimonadaceae bacterium]|nr:hypothetical protein [Gemmatimonadaceae bacterium]